MMKKLLIFVFVLFSAYSIQAQNVSPEEEKAVKQLVQDTFDDVFSDLDSTKIKKHLTDDFLLLEQGEIWNNETIKHYLASALKSEKTPQRVNKFEFIKFVKSKNSIWVAYHNYAIISMEGKVVAELEWLESAVAIKTKEGWKLQMMHSTRVNEE
jgi:hypothetical protein